MGAIALTYRRDEIIGLRESGLSYSLHAATKMRLISMSDEDLWELARVTCPPSKST